jgi:hypothetical protein
MVLWSGLPMSAQAQSVEPAAEPENGSAAGSDAQNARTITLGNVGTWSIAEGVEVSRRMVQGPDGEVTVITLERLTEHGEVAPGSFVTLSLYPEGITLQGSRLTAESALQLTVDSIAASSSSDGTTSAALACQVGGQDGFCTEFTVPSVGGVLQVDARAVVVGDSLVTTVLVRSPEADAELAALLGDALRLETP